MRVAFMGDLIPGGIFYDRLQRNRFCLFPREFQMLLEKFEMRVCNLECPLYDGTVPNAKKTVLRSPTESGRALKSAGIDLVSLANNHIFDYGVKGLQSTISVLRQHGIDFIGAGMSLDEARIPHVLSNGGVKVGFLAYSTHDLPYMTGSPCAAQNSPGIAPMSWPLMREDVLKLKEKCDHVVLLMHWGKEHTSFPPSENLCMARDLLELGVDLIVGTHPHCIQGRLSEGQRHAFLSLGNLLFPNYYYEADSPAEPVMVYPHEMQGKSQVHELRIAKWSIHNRISILLDVTFCREASLPKCIPVYQTELSCRILVLDGWGRFLVGRFLGVLSVAYTVLCYTTTSRIVGRIVSLVAPFSKTVFRIVEKGYTRLLNASVKMYGR